LLGHAIAEEDTPLPELRRTVEDDLKHRHNREAQEHAGHPGQSPANEHAYDAGKRIELHLATYDARGKNVVVKKLYNRYGNKHGPYLPDIL
jgi:hypothetical protein